MRRRPNGADRRHDRRSPRQRAGGRIRAVQLGVVLGLSALTTGSRAHRAVVVNRASTGSAAVGRLRERLADHERSAGSDVQCAPSRGVVSPRRQAREGRRAETDRAPDARNEELQYQDARQRGFRRLSREVDAGFREVAARYPSPQAFAAAVAEARLTEDAVRHEVQRTILIRKAREAAVTSQCGVDGPEAARFFESHPARFVMPEQLRIQAITIGVDPSSPPTAWAAGKPAPNRCGAACSTAIRSTRWPASTRPIRAGTKAATWGSSTAAAWPKRIREGDRPAAPRPDQRRGPDHLRVSPGSHRGRATEPATDL